VLEPQSRAAGAEPEPAVDEVAIDRSDPGLAAGGHGADDDVLHAGQVVHHLPGGQPARGREDGGGVGAQSRMGAIQDRLQLSDLRSRLEHRRLSLADALVRRALRARQEFGEWAAAEAAPLYRWPLSLGPGLRDALRELDELPDYSDPEAVRATRGRSRLQ